jgi:predicted acylesterase/phospholipase RssA
MSDQHDVVSDLQRFPYPKREALKNKSEVDMVMKGGITSGVVYPLAVCELAKKKLFRNLGGSSAGGIAAGLAAAAELGRDSGGFQRLAGLPQALGTDLLKIFQPSRTTKPLFRILLAGMDKEHGPIVKVLLLVWSVIRAAWVAFTIAFALVLLFGFWALLLAAGPSRTGDAVHLLFGLACLLPPAFALGFVAALGAVALRGPRRLESNGYGLCRGSVGATWQATPPAKAPVEPFTDWLHAKFNEISGHERSKVVTFGDLWGCPPHTATRPDDPEIRLEMMTTNVTFCRPVRLPFESHLYSFCETELREYFPSVVVDHLVDNARAASTTPATTWHCPDHDEKLVRLPVAGDFPVLVAIRMTLSFPLLISPVPLFAIDYRAKPNVPVRCWFADGGISSNFPIHFFDALWPKRPTLGISLGPRPAHGGEDVHWEGSGTHSVSRVRDTSTFTGFIAAMVDTLQNWSDEGQAMLPGYRDRIIEVRHSKEEGGMNLNMPAERILAMSLRGHAAAVELQRNFDFADHRSIRYRSSMGRLDQATHDMACKYDNPLPGGLPGYREFIDQVTFANMPEDWPACARQRTDTLLQFAGRAPGDPPPTTPTPAPTRPDPDFTKKGTEPRPVPDLRTVARF